MKIYRISVEPEEGNWLFLQCINDPKVFTQARSLDEAVYMVRDLVALLYNEKRIQIELIVPPDITTFLERRSKRRVKRPTKKPKPLAVGS